MGWVVKELRTDLFDALRHDAERDARRIRRAADRTAGSVAEELLRLEVLAVELQAVVRRRRLSAILPAPAPAPAPAPVPAAAGAARARRGARASMRSSPLTDLIRASGPRPRFPRALLDAG